MSESTSYWDNGGHQPVTQHELTAAALSHANTVSAFREEHITGVELPFGWAQHDGQHALASLEVARGVINLHEGIRVVNHKFKTSIQVESELNDWPEDAIQEAATRHETLIEVGSFLLKRNHLLSVKFDTSNVDWIETYDYALVHPEDENDVIDASSVVVDSGHPLNMKQSEEVKPSSDDDMFAALCGDIGQQLLVERQQRRLQQAMAIVRCIRGHEPIALRSFFESGMPSSVL